MTLFSLARKNMLGNLKSYVIYFSSLLISVVIYYTFVSLQYSSNMKRVFEQSEAVSSIFLQASIILILFVFVFIWYSNAFFTRKRKKEIGLYALLGLRKRTIGRMLFYENMIIGAFVLAAGIVLGTFLSKLFAMILAKLVGSTAEMGVTISLGAIGNTALVFGLILLFTSLQSYRLIYRFSLLELFQAEKKEEKAPKMSWIAATGAVLLLAVGYRFLLEPIVTTEQFLRNLLIATIGIVCGTDLLFRFFTVLLLKLAKKSKSRYYKGLNLITVTHLMHRIQGNARTFTMIALLSALTISAISNVFSLYYVNTKSAEREMPFSYMHVSGGEAFDEKVRQAIAADADHPIMAQLDYPVLEAQGDLSGLDMRVSDLGEYERAIRLVSVTDYDRVAETLGRKERLQLAGDEAVIIRPQFTDYESAGFAGRSIVLDLSERDVELKLTGLVKERIAYWRFPDLFFVVSDELFAELAGQTDARAYKGYLVKDPLSAKETAGKLESLATEQITIASQYKVYKRGLEENGMNIFLIGFLGLVFLAATGSIVYFKQLTEFQADQDRYRVLRKIGASHKSIRGTVASQTMFVFAMPLVVGLAHSYVINQAMSLLYGNLIDVNLNVPVFSSLGMYFVIYLFYYLLCVQSGNRIASS